MILREIDMDLPYIPDANKDQTVDDTRRDYELNWKKKRRQFQLMTRCITSMIERIIPRITTKDCRKILIQCMEKPSREGYINLLGVYAIQIPFDINLFLEMDSLAKKKYVVNKIRETMKTLAGCISFSVEEIENACDKIEDSNYVNEWYWVKPKKNKKISVRVKVSHEVESVSIYLVFEDLINKVYKEKFLVSDLPDEWAYTKYLGKLELISDDTARLSTCSGESFVVTYE